MWTICFGFSTRRHCITIPLLIDWWWWHRPPPPPPWIEVEGFDPEMATHLQSLVTIDRIAAELPAQYAQDLQRIVASHIQTIGKTLGEGVNISRRYEKP
jgi:hypothetical protein